jgi:hypothetical protein
VPLILALRILKQEDSEFKTHLGCISRSCPKKSKPNQKKTGKKKKKRERV